MLSGQQSIFDERVVGMDRRCNHDGIDFRVVENVSGILRKGNVGVLNGEFPASVYLSVAADNDGAIRRSIEIPDEIGAPVTQANDAYSDTH
jgi:hypothetical protein